MRAWFTCGFSASARTGIQRRPYSAALAREASDLTVLTDAFDVLSMAQAHGYRTVLSARSADTEDSWLADLAIASRAGQIKVESTQRAERTAKWNRLLQIEA